MGKAFWFLTGIGVGFVVAHQINKTEGGREFFDTLNQRTQEFTEAVTEGFRERAEAAYDDLRAATNE